MYLPTLSASLFVLVRTRLWTLKPEWGQEINRSAHSGLRISRPTRNDNTSRAINMRNVVEDACGVQSALRRQEMDTSFPVKASDLSGPIGQTLGRRINL